MHRRDVLLGLAGFASGIAGATVGAGDPAFARPVEGKTETAGRPLADSAVYVPGYITGPASANGLPVSQNPRFMRDVDDANEPFRLLSRIGLNGDIRQTLLPAHAHDVAISPDRRLGILCGFENRGQVAFDAETLELVALEGPFAEGWRGGGHAEFINNGQMVILSERAPRRSVNGNDLEQQYGRITIRDSETLKIRESYSTYGIDPHDIRVIEDGRYLVAANYGSLPSEGMSELSVPRSVAEACITVIDMQSGALVDKWVTNREDTETRHLASGGLNRIFAIQAAISRGEAEKLLMGDHDVAYDLDITSEHGITYMPAKALRVDPSAGPLPMGTQADLHAMRHGLSIEYDTVFDQVIATYPSSHYVFIFDGSTGNVITKFDTSRTGLRYPCGITLLPDGQHYAITGYWENLFVYERNTHRLVRELCLYPTFFGHSHITSA